MPKIMLIAFFLSALSFNIFLFSINFWLGLTAFFILLACIPWDLVGRLARMSVAHNKPPEPKEPNQGALRSGKIGISPNTSRHDRRNSITNKYSGAATSNSKGLRCIGCNKLITAKEEALFVEEEVGRFFCSEVCITTHFTPEIEILERLYGKHASPNDLSAEERERFSHFRWVALEKPDEVWREKTESGDFRYTLVAEFKPEQKTVWAVNVCLMLRGDPSFLYLAFVTRDRNLVAAFSKGEQLRIIRRDSLIEEGCGPGQAENSAQDSALVSSTWTDPSSLRSLLIKERKEWDIPVEDFGFYQECLAETLKNPNELWSYLPKSAKKMYHFIKHHDDDSGAFWYVIIARDTLDETQIEIIDSFPTRDPDLIQQYRNGKKEKL
jgi:hypothetical protein